MPRLPRILVPPLLFFHGPRVLILRGFSPPSPRFSTVSIFCYVNLPCPADLPYPSISLWGVFITFDPVFSARFRLLYQGVFYVWLIWFVLFLFLGFVVYTSFMPVFSLCDLIRFSCFIPFLSVLQHFV